MDPDPTALEIKKLRQQFKISLLELSANTGLPTSYLEMIEEGKIVASDNDYKRIMKTLWRLSSQER